MTLKDKKVVVTGGSRGLGLGLVEALVSQGAKVTVVARRAESLDAVSARLGVATISADVTDKAAAHHILGEVRPDILALNAGATPRMGRLDQLSWEDFSVAWETDVKAGLYSLQAALSLTLKLGIRFQAIVPRQIILGTGTGDAAANAYAGSMGITPEQFVARFGAPMPPRAFGDRVVSVLEDPQYADGVVFGLNGDAGVTVMEGVAA